MITVKLPTPKKSKVLGCLYSIIRETVSGVSATFLFFLLWIVLPGEYDHWFALFLSLAVFFGIRRFFPTFSRKVSVELPEDLSKDAFTVFLSACTENLTLLRKDAKRINHLPFRHTVLHLCELGDDLLVSFAKVPRNVQIAQTLPDRLHRLHEVLTGYLELAGQRNPPPRTMRALEDTEKAVTKAVARFEQLHHRLAENDAMDQSVNARTLDNLLDFD